MLVRVLRLRPPRLHLRQRLRPAGGDRVNDRVVLLHSIPGHAAGEHGRIHGGHHHWVGVIFDTVPGMVRYVEPVDIAPEVPVSDEAVESTLDHADRVLFNTLARSIENDADTPCNYIDADGTEHCSNAAVWWFECQCGQTMFGCEPHRTWYDQWMTKVTANGKYLRCVTCKTPRPVPLPWRAL